MHLSALIISLASVLVLLALSCAEEGEELSFVGAEDGDGDDQNAVALPGAEQISPAHRQALIRLHRIEKAYNLTQFNPDFDDMNHLEYYWHEISHFIRSNVPPTDPQCFFNVTAWRCFPVCDCSFQPKPGDYTLSRACRIEEDPNKIDICVDEYRDVAWLPLLAGKLHAAIGSGVKKVKESIPETDDECMYDFRTNCCVPEEQCAFQWRFGDLTPARACRLRPLYQLDYDDEEDDEVWERAMRESSRGLFDDEFDDEYGFESTPHDHPDPDSPISRSRGTPEHHDEEAETEAGSESTLFGRYRDTEEQVGNEL